MPVISQNLTVGMDTDRQGEGKNCVVRILQGNPGGEPKVFPHARGRKKKRKFIQRQIMDAENMELPCAGVCRGTEAESAALEGRIKSSDKGNVVKLLLLPVVRHQPGGKDGAQDHAFYRKDGIGQTSQGIPAEKLFQEGIANFPADFTVKACAAADQKTAFFTSGFHEPIMNIGCFAG